LKERSEKNRFYFFFGFVSMSLFNDDTDAWFLIFFLSFFFGKPIIRNTLFVCFLPFFHILSKLDDAAKRP